MARAETKKAAHKKTENLDKKTEKLNKKAEKHDKKTESTILPPSSLWYTILPPLPPATNLRVPSAAQINLLIEKSASLMEKDTKSFLSASSSSSSEATFFAKVIHAGTLSDRLSALTLLVQSSPVHNTKALDTLKNMAGKAGGGRNESLKALRCIVDWWVGGGAPDRKLKYFRDQPLLHPQVSDDYLLLWYFEDWLKKYFFSVLQILETLSLDPVPYARTQVISLIFTLLRDKPEQEQNLLRLLVNKLGDTSKSICSRASYHLLQLLQSHPSMKSVVVREITSLILRPSILSVPTTAVVPANNHIRPTSPGSSSKSSKSKLEVQDTKTARNSHAQYYATITFNQIVLTPSSTDREVALRLIDIYFELFQVILGSDSSHFGDAVGKEGDEHLLELDGQVQKDKKGRVVVRGKGKGGKEKGKETIGAAGFIEVEDSNSRLISAILTGVNRALPFAKVEAQNTKIDAHLDTLFLITHKSTFNISVQALVLIHQISLNFFKSSSSPLAKSIVDRYFRTLYASLYDHRLNTSSKQAMYLNLLYRSIKTDPEVSSERRMAMVKRFAQVLVSGGSGATEFVVGGLYLLGELFTTVPGLRSMISFKSESEVDAKNYDAHKRNPLYACAAHSCLWELTPLLLHFHPTISLLTRQILTTQPLTATPDLSQNTLSHFLDRFVYKNPKKNVSGTEGKGSSAMQPSGSATEGIKLFKGEALSVQVNSPSFWKNKKEAQIPVDQIFFYDYFKRKNESERKSKKKKKQVDGDGDNEEADEDEESDEQDGATSEKGSDGTIEDQNEEDEDIDLEEAEIWKAMKATMPQEEHDLLSDNYNEDESEDEDENNVEHDDTDEKDSDAEKDDTDDALSLAEASEDDDLIPLDEMPDGVIAYDGSLSESEEWGGIKSKTRKRKQADDKETGLKKKRRSLPTFVNYEDYAKMIEDGPENNI